MKTLIEFYKWLDKSTKHKIQAFLWTTFNWVIWIIITYLSWLNYEMLIVIIPVLNLISKEINKYFNPNYWK
jgi:hypothetical protein